MKTPTGIPRMAPIRKPQAAEPRSQPIRMQIPITAMVVPIRTEPAPARLSFGVWDGSIGGASIAEFVTYEIRLVQRKFGDFVRMELRRSDAARPPARGGQRGGSDAGFATCRPPARRRHRARTRT